MCKSQVKKNANTTIDVFLNILRNRLSNTFRD